MFDLYGTLVPDQVPKKLSPSVVTDRRLCAPLESHVKTCKQPLSR